MARSLEFYRATYGVKVRPHDRQEGSVVTWTIRSFSFWRPIEESVLKDKLDDVLLQVEGYDLVDDLGYEDEEVGSSESRGIGFYRWDVIDERAHTEVQRIHRDYVMRPDGSEVRWRR